MHKEYSCVNRGGDLSDVANGLFNTPFGIAIDSSGNANVSDIENKNNRIQKFKKDGTFIRTCTEG